MTSYIIAALILWLVAGVALGLILGPRLPHRVSEAELFRRAVEQDAEWRERLMQ